jgi:steroid delta-isomerase-like uncharacterized protein
MNRANLIKEGLYYTLGILLIFGFVYLYWGHFTDTPGPPTAIRYIMNNRKIILVIFIVFAVLASFQCTLKKGNDAMSAEKSKATVLRFVDKVQNQHEIGALDELFNPDFIDHSGISTEPNLDGTKQFFTMFFTAFPDIQVTIHDQVAEGDKVWMRKTFKGTHQGEFMGIPPTGKHVEINVIDIHRVVDGKIIEHWAVADMLGLMQQLGAIPPPGKDM